MFSPYLQSLEHVTSRVSGGNLRVKYIALGLHIHFFLMKFQNSTQNVNQSETEIGDKKLSVELYVNI